MQTVTGKNIIQTLPNGIRVIYQQVQSKNSHLGLMFNVGSRDETARQNGLAHLTEHLLFKGTPTRNYMDVISTIENVGGEINAYTSKEETCLYASLLSDYYEQALDVLTDICFRSSFPDDEILKEKEIVIDEINSYKDSPSELICDEFEELLFPHNSLGPNILGTKKLLTSYGRKQLLEFNQTNYGTNQVVLSYVGNVSFAKFWKSVEKILGVIPEKHCNNQNRIEPSAGLPFIHRIKKRTHQSHYMLGGRAYSLHHSNKIAMSLLNNILGGNNFSALLNLRLREENGLTYNIESNYTAYADTGVFAIYFGTDIDKTERCLEIIKSETDVLCNNPLSSEQLEIYKKQLIGQIALSADNYSALMQSNAKSLLNFNEVDSFEEVYAKIQAVDAQLLCDVANEVLRYDNLSHLHYQ